MTLWRILRFVSVKGPDSALVSSSAVIHRSEARASNHVVVRPCFLALILVPALAAGTRADSLLYNGALNTTPNAQGWFYGTDSLLATQSAAGGVTTFSTTAANSIRAGYSTLNPI